MYEKNRARSRNAFKIDECAEFIAYADARLQEGWSPDAIVGRASIEDGWRDKSKVCAKTLYNYIDLGLMKTKNIDLAMKVQRKPKNKKTKKNKKILGDSIETRPEIVETREEFGHWEIDSVIGKQSDETAVMTLVERKTREQIAVKVYGRGSEAIDIAVAEVYQSFGKKAELVMKSITGDNGHEFAGLKDAAKCAVYFCHPYSSFEKGTNERHNGLLRRFVKKGKSIDKMSPELISMAAAWNNNLPRKILGYKTPNEVFAEELCKISEPSADNLSA